MTDLISAFKVAWDLWCLPFSLVPYGDPYLASLSIFCLGGFAVKKLING